MFDFDRYPHLGSRFRVKNMVEAELFIRESFDMFQDETLNIEGSTGFERSWWNLREGPRFFIAHSWPTRKLDDSNGYYLRIASSIRDVPIGIRLRRAYPFYVTEKANPAIISSEFTDTFGEGRAYKSTINHHNVEVRVRIQSSRWCYFDNTYTRFESEPLMMFKCEEDLLLYKLKYM